MIERVPLFGSLDRPAVVELSKRLRAVVALPGEKIIRVGGPPDSMYFIAAGEVTVQLPNFQVTLKEGDFVGEMGLISDSPRSADVVSDGYCHLLALVPQGLPRPARQAPDRPQRDRSHGRPPHRRERGQGDGVVGDRRIMVFRTARVSRSLMIMSAPRGARSGRV